jgi:hypothetical protein
MPLPLASCAFFRSSDGTSTVIFLAAFMVNLYPIAYTSTLYGEDAKGDAGQEMRGMRDIHHQPVAGWYLLVGRNLAITPFGY